MRVKFFIFNPPMKRLCMLFLVLLASSVVCLGQDTLKSNLNKYYPVNQLKSDFVFFRTVMEQAHPSLYRYFPKDSIDQYFNIAHNKLDHPLTEIEYWQILQNITAKIGSGHTNISLEKGFDFDNGAPHDMLPFNIYIHNDRIFVNGLYHKTDTAFKTGDEILVINNEYALSILQKMRGLVTGDGYSNSFKDFQLEAKFIGLYNLMHGDQYQFMIFFKRGDRVIKKLVPAVKLRLVTTGASISSKKNNVWRPPLTYPADMPSTAILKINYFTYKDYSSTHNAIFKELKKNGIKNLVIDLRNNTGGSENVCIDLMQHLMEKMFYFHIGQEGAINIDRFKYFVKQSNKSPGSVNLTFLLSEHGFFREKNQGNSLQALAWNNYKGNVYLLVNKATYSAATLFAVAIKAQRDCTIIGEETGGGMAGCDGSEILRIILPNTHLNLHIPTLWTYSAIQAPNYGFGLKPDIDFSPTPDKPYSEYMEHDPIMDVVKKAIITSGKKVQ